MSDSPVIGSASFELRARKDQLMRDVRDAQRDIGRHVRDLERAYGESGRRMSGRISDPILRDVAIARTALASLRGASEGALQGIASQSALAGGALGRMTGPLLAIGAAAGGVSLLAAGVRRTAQAADDLVGFADRIRVSVEWLQELRDAGEQVDVSAQSIDRGLEGLTRSLGSVREGLRDKTILDAFRRLGFTPEQVRQFETVEQLLPVLADRLRAVGNTASQTRIAEALQAGELAPLLRQGSAAIGDLQRNAREGGRVMRRDLAQGAADANEQFRQLARTIDVELASAFAPVAREAGESTSEVRKLISYLSQLAGMVVTATIRVVTVAVQAYENTQAGLSWLARNTPARSGAARRMFPGLARAQDADDAIGRGESWTTALGLRGRGANRGILDSADDVRRRVEAERRRNTPSVGAGATVDPGWGPRATVVDGPPRGGGRGRGGGGGSSAPRGIDQAQRDDRFADELRRARERLVEAIMDTAGAEQRTRLEAQQIEDAYTERAADIRRSVARKQFTEQQGTQLLDVAAAQRGAETAALLRRQAEAGNREILENLREQVRFSADQLAEQERAAQTEEERARLALERVDAEHAAASLEIRQREGLSDARRQELLAQEATLHLMRRKNTQMENERLMRERRLALEQDELSRAADLARLRGNEDAAQQFDRQMAFNARVAALEADGATPDKARTVAGAEMAERDQARLQGQFREAFTGGITAALDGDLGSAFSRLAERFRASLLDGLADQLFAMFSQAAGGKGGGFVGSIFSLFSGVGTGVPKSLKGFATGGSFKVGGIGGTDSQLIAFRATPGEMVDVRTPGQQAAPRVQAGGNTYNLQGAVLWPDLWAQIQQEVATGDAKVLGAVATGAARQQRRASARLGR